MGVKTKKFGPFAWKTLHALAKRADATKSYSEFQELLCLLGMVIPCVYCRLSVRQFLATDHTLDVKRIPHTSCELFVYLLHNRVNRKLYLQERLKATTDAERLAIKQKWDRYTPSFSQARESTLDTHHQTFWIACFTFLWYILCDFPAPDAKRRTGQSQLFFYQRFFELIGIITQNKFYQEAFTSVQPLWSTTMTLGERMDVWFALQKHMCRKAKIPLFIPSIQTLSTLAKEGIVGCVPT